jgi:methyl acetate hydrolase
MTSLADRLTAALTPALAAAGIPGAVAAVGNRAGTHALLALGATAPGGPALASDAVYQIASMTKALTSVAAMQLVEQGRLALDADIGALLPDLANPRVITGFAEYGSVQTRPANGPITLKHLLTHTSGLGYDFIHEAQGRARGPNPPVPGSKASLLTPLLFDPGADWAYGINTDWAGLAVEAVSGMTLGDWLAAHVTGPLGMADTHFAAHAVPAERLVPLHARGEDGALAPFPLWIGGGPKAEFHGGGGGLVSTAADYLTFTRMLLNGGSLAGARVLAPETVAAMTRSQIAPLRAGVMGTTMPALSLSVDWFPGQHTGWGLGFMINPEPGPAGRSAGSNAWAGICNTYYWFDPAADVAAVLMMQLLPFADPGALNVLAAFERAVYAG